MPDELTLPGVPSSVPAARQFVQAALDGQDLELVAWMAAVLVSELVTNAMLHARTPITVLVSAEGDGPVRLEVRDGSSRVPRVRGYGEEATTGRGLHLVQDLASRWGVHSSAVGKTVWVELDRGAAPDPEQVKPEPGACRTVGFADRPTVPGSPRATRPGAVSVPADAAETDLRTRLRAAA